MADYCSTKIAIVVPEKFLLDGLNDPREFFVQDTVHYHGDTSPMIIKTPHARLTNCSGFEMLF